MQDASTLELYRQIGIDTAAEFLDVSTQQLEKWRRHGGGPKFIKLGHRSVRYRLKDLIEFQESRLASNNIQARNLIEEGAA